MNKEQKSNLAITTLASATIILVAVGVMSMVEMILR